MDAPAVIGKLPGFFPANDGHILYDYHRKWGNSMRIRYVNGRIYTGQLPLQHCFVVEDGKFVFVGRESDAPEGEREVDLQGRFVCPGFNDAPWEPEQLS